jgi:hypothetical protein
MGNVIALRQEILNGRWQLNGEPIIIGSTGLVLNGQHTLIALITACQAYNSDPNAYPAWDHEPTIDKVITVGISEEDSVVNTMDTGKPRSLADVIYRSSYFADVSKMSDHQKLSRVLDHAVSFLWKRTAAGGQANVRRTHSESLDFIERHPKLLETVAYIYSENTGKNQKTQEQETNRISRYISNGYAAGLLYLMGASKSNFVTYSSNPCEEEVDFSLYAQACAYWNGLANTSADVGKPIVAAMATAEWGGSVAEKTALLVKGWIAYRESDKNRVTPAKVRLEYTKDDDGFFKLAEQPVSGGIDIGDPKELKLEADVVGARPEDYVPEVGDTTWVHDESGNHWHGTIVSVDRDNPQGAVAMVECAEGYDDESGQEFEVYYNQLVPESPDGEVEEAETEVEEVEEVEEAA